MMHAIQFRRRLRYCLLAGISVFLAEGVQAMTINVGGRTPLDRATLTTTYHEAFAPGTVPGDALFGILGSGPSRDGVWFGEVSQGMYRLTNNSKEDAIRYFHFNRVPKSPADWTQSQGAISVEVGVENDQGGGAGLLYAFDPDVDPADRNYYALFLSGSGGYAFYHRTKAGMHQILSGPVPEFRPGELNELAIVTRGDTMEIYANGKMLGSVAEDGKPVSGHVGLIAAGKGRFLFDNFKTYDTAVGKRPQTTKTAQGPQVTSPVPPTTGRPSMASADPFVGRFSGEGLTLEIEAAATGYTGHILFGKRDFPVKASVKHGRLQGVFTSESHEFPFTVQSADGRLSLETEGAVYHLEKEYQPVNPLAPAPDSVEAKPAPVPSAAPTQSVAPRPPEVPVSLLYNARIEAKETDVAKEFFFRVDIAPMGENRWLVKRYMSADGKTFDEEADYLVDAHGGRIDGKMRLNPQKDPIIYYWFPAATEVDGFGYAYRRHGENWVFQSTDDVQRRMEFAGSTGHLIRATRCFPQGCLYLEAANTGPKFGEESVQLDDQLMKFAEEFVTSVLMQPHGYK